MVAWLSENAGSVHYGDKFTREAFLFQAKCYLATKDIVKENGIDFASIKCMPDMTGHYTPQCLTAAFLTPRGKKRRWPCPARPTPTRR